MTKGKLLPVRRARRMQTGLNRGKDVEWPIFTGVSTSIHKMRFI